MKSFKEYAEQRMLEDVALLLWATDADIEEFCETVRLLGENKKLSEELITELGWRNMLGGISNAAANVAGLGGLGRMGADAMRAGGQAIGRGAQALGNVIKDKATAARDAVAQRYAAGKEMLGRGAQAVGQGASRAWDATGGAASRAATSAGQAVGRGANNFMNTAGEYMAQSKQAEQLRQATNAVNALHQQLKSYGYPDNLLNQSLNPLMQALQHDTTANSANRGFKMGSGGYGVAPPVMGQTA